MHCCRRHRRCEDFADWREPGAAALWQGLRRLLAANPDRLAVLASGRYRHPDFAGAIVPFRRLPDDAQWRLLRWFPTLRRLSEEGRAGLVKRLAGHPRAVEFIEALIAAAIAGWEEDNGPFAPGSLSVAGEQAQIIDAALPELVGQLSEDLLFAALLDRVLGDASRDLLVRAGVLRRPGSRDLLLALAGGEAGAAAIVRLRTTGLLTETAARAPPPSPPRATAAPATTWKRWRGPRALCRTGSRPHTTCSRGGEADRSYDLLGPLVQTLLNRGQLLEARAQLKDIGDPDALQPARAAVAHSFAGDVAVVSGNLTQALTAYRDSKVIFGRLAAADPGNAGGQRDLSVSHERIGDVLVAQGQLQGALTACRAALAIAERLAAADPGNAQWQPDLFVSHAKLGNLLKQSGDRAGAAEHYGRGLAITVRLSERDPSNATWRNDRRWLEARLAAVDEEDGEGQG